MSFNKKVNYCNTNRAKGKLLTYATVYSIIVHSHESGVQRSVAAGAPWSWEGAEWQMVKGRSETPRAIEGINNETVIEGGHWPWWFNLTRDYRSNPLCYKNFYFKKKEAKTENKKKAKTKALMGTEITHPQFHRRRGWFLCSWCGAHSVKDRQRKGQTVREIEKEQKSKCLSSCYNHEVQTFYTFN